MDQRTSSVLGIEQLACLHDEIAAISRAKLPLGDALTAFGNDVPGKLGAAAREVGSRIASGESLEQAVGAVSSHWPQAYSAVVKIGVRVGRLPAALEAIADVSRTIVAARRAVLSAMIPPLFVFFLGYGLLLFFIATSAQTMLDFALELKVPRIEQLQSIFDAMRSTMWLWGPAIPLLIIAYLAFSWFRLGRTIRISPERGRRSLHPVRRLASLQAIQMQATFCDLLALLVENQVPLPEAIRLAQRALGPSLEHPSLEVWATALERGERAPRFPEVLPSALEAALTSGDPRANALVLRAIATERRREAASGLYWLTTKFPLIAVFLFAGSMAITYVAVTIVPWMLMLNRLSTLEGV